MSNPGSGDSRSGRVNKWVVIGATLTTIAGVAAAMFTFGSSLLAFLGTLSEEPAPPAASEPTREAKPSESSPWASQPILYFQSFDKAANTKGVWSKSKGEYWESTLEDGSFCLRNVFSREELGSLGANPLLSTYTYPYDVSRENFEYPVSV